MLEKSQKKNSKILKISRIFFSNIQREISKSEEIRIYQRFRSQKSILHLKNLEKILKSLKNLQTFNSVPLFFKLFAARHRRSICKMICVEIHTRLDTFKDLRYGHRFRNNKKWPGKVNFPIFDKLCTNNHFDGLKIRSSSNLTRINRLISRAVYFHKLSN